MSDYEYEYDFEGPQPGLTGFLEPDDTAAAAGFGSPGSAASAGFGSPDSVSVPKKMNSICEHGNKKRGACKKCFDDFNAERVMNGREPVKWGFFCKHGLWKWGPKPCQDPECSEMKPYTPRKLKSTFDPQFKPTGYINPKDRQFEPPVPKSAGLSFSRLESSQVFPVSRTLFRTKGVFDSSSEDELSGGRKSSRKTRGSSRKTRGSSRKTRGSSRKTRGSSRKTRGSSRKTRGSSRKTRGSSRKVK